MDVVLSATSGQPFYSQVAQQIAGQIMRGELTPGTALPPIRSVARQLEVSVITVKKAWDELEHQGFIYGVVGKGSFVCEHPPDGLDDKRDRLARAQMARDLLYYKNLGLNQSQVVALVRALFGS